MSDIQITDLVPQDTIDKVNELNDRIQKLLITYTGTAKELAKGVDINIKVVGDIDKFDKLLIATAKEAEETQKKLTSTIDEQRRVIANTTNTISRQLMEQERINKTQREAYTDTEKFKNMLEKVNGSYEDRVKRLVEVEREIRQLKEKEKELNDTTNHGASNTQKYMERMVEIRTESRRLQQEKATLTQTMRNEEKEMASVEGSYDNLHQRLELMKKAYKELTEEERNSSIGMEMEANIQNLDAHLKDLAADMGEFQRNVGNYAIAGQNGVVTTESLVAVMQQEALTQQDLVDQTKILEEAKLRLNTNDTNYERTLASLNAKIEENKRKLTDVSDILDKEATTAAEAEAQNKRLQEAMKHVDMSADGAQQKIDQLNAKITKNKEVIDAATPSIEKLAKKEEELNRQREKHIETSKGLADQVLNLMGVNDRLGSSFVNLQTTGNVWDGLGTKVKAFGTTLLGLLSNPWVLAFLGIGGVVAGVKWWYDYNKGLEEASRLTKNFTGATGEAADKVTADIGTLADTLGSNYKDTIEAANQLVQHFGISWGETIQLMEDGYVAGANMSGNMVENIKKFTPALRDAGISANEFIAVLSNTKNGIFDEKGVQNIIKAGTRLRSMTKNIAADLDAVGISSKKMQEDLETGNITMMDAIQQVAGKLKELPENSQRAGAIMKDVFGRTAAEGGALLIQSIADINTNLDECIDNMGEMGKLNREQMNAQKELQETLSSVFKMSGTSFQELTTRAKTFVIQGLTKIIKGCVDIVNWFIRMYNKSIVVRGAFNSFVNAFQTIWEVAKFVFKQLIDGFKGIGTAIEGILTLDWDLVKKGWTDGVKAMAGNLDTLIRNIASNTAKAFKDTISSEMKEVTIDLNANLGDLNNGYGGDVRDGDFNGSKLIDAENEASKKAREKEEKARKAAEEKARRQAEKDAKEQLKILQNLEESKLALMEAGHEKDLFQIKVNYKKKLDAIKGNSAEEEETRLNLMLSMNKELRECEEKYIRELAESNLKLQLAAVEKGSDEEFRLRLAMLEVEKKKEIETAEEKGISVSLIEAKYLKLRSDLRKQHSDEVVDLAEKEFAKVQQSLDDELAVEQLRLAQAMNQELAAARNNEEKREKIKEKYERQGAEIAENYAILTVANTKRMLEELLRNEMLTTEERERLELELARTKIALEDEMAKAAEASMERQIAATHKATEARKNAASTWLGVASDATGEITSLVSAVYDNQIARIEELQNALNEQKDNELQKIQELIDSEVISQEEGEARKRAAEALSAQKEKELATQKAALQVKQAKWEKANSIAQASIATALAITQCLPNFILAAIAAAMGAVQIATIAATPIPQYKEGTDYHKGGFAVVGDGGRREVVLVNGMAWLTPDVPTLVDMPRGASVIPSLDDMRSENLVNLIGPGPERNLPVKVYDDYRMRREVSRLYALIYRHLKIQRADRARMRYERFKSNI